MQKNMLLFQINYRRNIISVKRFRDRKITSDMALKLLLICLATAPVFSQIINLEQYNIDPNEVTVSGISSGGAFATQYHVAHSAQVKGAAMFAGIVYYCAKETLGTALTCMSSPFLTNVNSLINKANSYSDSGDIDPVSSMAGSKVFIWHGTRDTTVVPGNGPLIEEFYQAFNADILTQFEIVGQHCQPTDYYGPVCTYSGGEYINNCAYDGAFEALNFMYDNNMTKVDETYPPKGIYSLFNQKEFFPLNDATSVSMDDTGYVYIPSGCEDKTQTCKLHIVFHGCLQGQYELGDSFVRNTGYIQQGEANNIILVFPQAISQGLSNPNGCWDWWGYNKNNYATKSGDQVDGINKMIERLVNGA